MDAPRTRRRFVFVRLRRPLVSQDCGNCWSGSDATPPPTTTAPSCAAVVFSRRELRRIGGRLPDGLRVL
jgi:hypothetical protein